jgi:hypothetical protein
MRLLLDECVPRKLKAEFPGHDVKTAKEAGLAGLKNGQLLRAAERDFDVLITVDKGLTYQQNVKSFQLAVIVLIAKRNTYESLKPLIPKAMGALNSLRPSSFIQIHTD